MSAHSSIYPLSQRLRHLQPSGISVPTRDLGVRDSNQVLVPQHSKRRKSWPFSYCVADASHNSRPCVVSHRRVHETPDIVFG